MAKARRDDSEIRIKNKEELLHALTVKPLRIVIRIKNKEELLHALTDSDTFGKILEQGVEALEVSEYEDYLRESRVYILDYFMRNKDLVTAEELRRY